MKRFTAESRLQIGTGRIPDIQQIRRVGKGHTSFFYQRRAKGFSGADEFPKNPATDKYRALNELTLRGAFWLALSGL